MDANRREFWQRHPGLVWSNPDAGDAVQIRAALLHPRFGLLLDIALEFGLDRVREEWELLRAENTPEARRARDAVERILQNIQQGFAFAPA
jgi:hypothetical protein